MDSRSRQHDFDWLVVGSGFGGQRGGAAPFREGLPRRRARVRPPLRGRRLRRWHDLRRYFWAPRIGLRGVPAHPVQGRVHRLRVRASAAGASATRTPCRRARPAFFRDPQWEDRRLGGGDAPARHRRADARGRRLRGHDPCETSCCASTAPSSASPTFKPTRVGVFFGEAGREVPDPYFDGEGPRGPGACAAGAAWSAAATAPRTRW